MSHYREALEALARARARFLTMQKGMRNYEELRVAIIRLEELVGDLRKDEEQ